MCLEHMSRFYRELGITGAWSEGADCSSIFRDT